MTNIMDYFDQVYLINLPKRTDRLANARHELAKITDHFQIVIPIEHEDPKMSFNMTMLSIFQEAKAMQYDKICIFEDDVMIRNFDHLQEALNELPTFWSICYLGCNLMVEGQRILKPYSSKHLSLTNKAWTTHAVAYSADAILYIADFYKPETHGIFDAWLSDRILEIDSIHGVHVVRPMIAYQHPSKSDLWDTYADYTNAFIESDKKLL